MIHVYGRNPAVLLASLSNFYPILTPRGYLQIIRILIISVDIGSCVARQSGEKTAGLETYRKKAYGYRPEAKLSSIKVREEVSLLSFGSFR